MQRLTSALAVVYVFVAATTLTAQSTRLTIIISDLHMGVGREGSGIAWLPTEDFRWSAELQKFLTQISVDSNGNTDLVIAGDLLELWQPVVSNCDYSNKNFGCNEADALVRVRRVLDQHQAEMSMLADFARTGTNSLVIVPGNHDAALLFPAVQTVVKGALGNVPRIEISTTGFWLSADRKIVVEHGQQIGRDVNRFDRWPNPFIGPGGIYLQKTWGEQFVQSFYNRFEEKYPVIDNIADDGGIGYGIKAEGLAGMTMAVGKFLRFYLAGSSWAQFASSLGEANGTNLPEWDIERIRANGDAFLFESIPMDDPMREAAQTAYEQGALGLTLSDLSDDEIASICTSRLALVKTQTVNGGAATIDQCPSKAGMGAAVQALFGPARNKLVLARARDLLDTLRNTNALSATQKFDLYIYGHTHSPYGPTQIVVDPTWTLTSANTGAWQRIASAAQFKALGCGRSAAEVLRTPLDQLPACYSVIRVKPYSTKPTGELLYWVSNNGSWSLASSCNWKAPACL